MLDAYMAEIASYVGVTNSLLHFRIVCSSVLEEIKLAIEAAFRHHLKLPLAPTLKLSRHPRTEWERQFRFRSQGEMQLRLRVWLAEAHGCAYDSGISIGAFVTYALKRVGCWCAELQWPWVRHRLATCLSRMTFLPEIVWREPSQGFKLTRNNAYNFLTKLCACPWNEEATVKQMLNVCIALVCPEADIVCSDCKRTRYASYEHIYAGPNTWMTGIRYDRLAYATDWRRV